jgi:glutathione S-transferase
MDDLVVLLGNRPFFHGDELSVADLSVFGMLLVLRDSPITGGGTLLEERPALVTFMERVDKLTRAPRDPD